MTVALEWINDAPRTNVCQVHSTNSLARSASEHCSKNNYLNEHNGIPHQHSTHSDAVSDHAFHLVRDVWLQLFQTYVRTCECIRFPFRSQFSANLNTISRAGPTARTRAHNTVNCKLGFHIFEIDWCRRQLIAFCKAIIKIIIYSCNGFARLRLAAIQTGWSMDFEAHTHLWTTRPPEN